MYTLLSVLWSYKLTVLSFAPQMEPVQKAVINHTFGVSIPPKKKQVISCNVCQLRFNSDVSITFSLLSVACQLGVWLFWTCTSLHITYSLEAHLLCAVGGPFISVCSILKGFRFNIRNLNHRVANIKNQEFLYAISLICIILYLILPVIFTFQKYLNSRKYFLKV